METDSELELYVRREELELQSLEPKWQLMTMMTNTARRMGSMRSSSLPAVAGKMP